MGDVESAGVVGTENDFVYWNRSLISLIILSMQFKYEDLEVWQLSKGLIKLVYETTSNFPKDEILNLTSQIRRSATSCCLNISEGSGRNAKKDFSRFIRIAIGSLLEVDTCLKISIDLGYIQNEVYDKSFDGLIAELYFKLIKLDKALQSKEYISSISNSSNN